MKEPLAKFHMKNGEAINMRREDGNVSIETKEHQVIIPQATGQQTLDWIALLEGLAESVEYPEEEINEPSES